MIDDRASPTMETRLRRAFLALAVLWALLLPIAAYAASGPRETASTWANLLTYCVYRAGRVICHQRAERSFFLFGVPLPVCARCTGIYIGAAVTASVAAFRDLRAGRSHDRPRPGHVFSSVARDAVGSSLFARVRTFADARSVLVASALPSVATLVFEWSTGQMPAHWTRALSGATLGAGIAWIVCASSPRAADVM